MLSANSPPRLLLASASPRRRQLLGEMGVAFEVEAQEVVEWDSRDACPRELVLHNAGLKAASAARRHPARPVLASDTAVALGDVVLNKPADLAEARAMLHQLAGRTHTVYTAVCLAFRQRRLQASICVTSDVTFQPLDDARIDAYFDLVNPLDKAGAYGIQEGRDLIIERYEGSLSNIMGLPVEETASLLRRCGLLV